jgi:hypothetical protein
LVALLIAAQVATADVDRFWTERARAASPESLQAAYFAAASPEWKQFLAHSGHPQYFISALKLYPKFYASIEANTRLAASQSAEIEAALAKLSAMYGAPPPRVTIGIGRAGVGGIGRRSGVYLAAEFYAVGDGVDTSELSPWLRSVLASPGAIATAAVHEAVHTYQVESGEPSLLVACLREGAADFVAELVTGRPTKPALSAWCKPRRKQLFREFARSPRTGWIYDSDSPRPGNRPADIGYWIGQEIVRDFHARARDKRAALADLVEMRDPRTVVLRSRYASLVRGWARPERGGRTIRQNPGKNR